MRSPKFIIKNTTQRTMVKFVFGHRFHDLKYFEIRFFLTFLIFIINLRAPLHKFVEMIQFDEFFTYYKQILDSYVFDKYTCTLLAPSSKICSFYLRNICHHKLLGFVDQCDFQMLMIVPIQHLVST